MSTPANNSEFSEAERRGVYRAIYERRDIRSHFLPTPVPARVLGRLLDAAHHAPSVGFMQPWDFIVIRSESVRRAIRDCFLEANRRAAEIYTGERRTLYDSLKLEGILDAPVNLCITCDRERPKGAGVGRQTDSATDLYSTACAVQNLWLAARAESLGVGWVSILDFDRLRELLGLPARLVPLAYLCIGYVSEFPPCPELESRGWERRESLSRLIHFDGWENRDAGRVSELLG
ncbi:MAG TPA: 5,6-dimethylbenzimidazole synthase [Bryobacteraceae bacterium]|nr:5,6-dimethylbenzimidazole synthase [Bryobacteraceae bacterium]